MLAYLQRGGQMVLSILRPKKKLGWKSFIILGVLLLAVVLINTSAAAAFGWEDIAGYIASFALVVATFFLKLTIFLLTFIIQIAAYNGYLDSTAVNYGWVMVRDITNMCFVVILLLIAFGTILGLEQYEWKKLMVKFVLAAILVNFSRVICGVIIDIGQVVMVTFINGVAATAGGNLITMFNMDNIMSLTATGTINGEEILMASIAAVGFSALMLGVMAVFMIMLLYRVLSLWILIVLSPLAFVFSVIPTTQKYASEWWQEFGKNVVSGPMVAFFLWLAFVTVGGGNINEEIAGASQIPEESKIKDSNAGLSAADQIGQQSAGTSAAMSWTKMANFAIAIGMLLVGAEKAQQLGVKGGSMMSKATDFAKKATMVATGAAAGVWAAKGVYKGAKAAGKWGLMNAPFVGGNAWVTRGKKIAGRVGTKFEKFQKGRDILAKKLEEDKKKVSDLKFQYSKGIISKEKYDEGMAPFKAKGVMGMVGRNFKNFLAGGIETQGRGMKRGDDWMEAYKSAHEIREREYSVSSTPGGFAKLDQGVELAFTKTKGDEKKKRKEEMLGAAKLRTEQEERGKIEKPLADLRAEAAAADAAGGKLSPDKQKVLIELENKLKDFDRHSVTRAAAVAAVQAKTEAEGKKSATISMDRSILETGTGAALYKAQAGAKLAGEGFKAEEEDEVYKAELKIMEEEAAVLRSMGKVDEVAGIEARMATLRRAAGLIVAPPKEGELKGTRAEAETRLATAKTTLAAAEGNKDADPVAYSKAQQEVAEAEKAVLAFTQADTQKGAFDSTKTTEMIEKLIKAMESGDPAAEQAAIAEIKGDKGAYTAYASMFGSKRIEDTIMDRRSLGALRDIKNAIGKNKDTLDKSSNVGAQSVLRGSINGSVREGSEELGSVWKNVSKTAPSVYAARSSALRDHTYAFYRGKKQEMKDNAGQAEIWDKMGIEIPSGAAQEAVADELYAKNFKNMNYNQLMAAQGAHSQYMTKKKGAGQPITDEDRLIGLAMMNKFIDESWVDDGTMAVFSKDMDIDVRQLGRRKKRSVATSKGKVRLSRPDISTYATGLSGLGDDLSKDLLNGVKLGQQHHVDDFMRKFKRQIDASSPAAFNGKTAEELVNIIQNTEDAEFRDLRDEIFKKLGK